MGYLGMFLLGAIVSAVSLVAFGLHIAKNYKDK